jgi:transposase
VKRTAEGIEELSAFCREHRVELVVIEATGGYEKLPFMLLWEAGIPCALANPRAVRRFAEAMGYLEKTDKIDAGMIAHFAASKGLVARPPAVPAQQRLRALVLRLRQITDALTAQTNQRRFVDDRLVLATIDEMVALLRRQARQIEREITSVIGADPVWKALDRAFRTIKGVADRTVARLCAELPEIGTFTGKAIAKLAGLAPLAKDSGQVQGRRRIRQGRVSVRSILVVVAEIVRRHDPDFAAFHAKLRAAGKPLMAVRVAIARKLLVRLNAKARDVRLGLASNA